MASFATAIYLYDEDTEDVSNAPTMSPSCIVYKGHDKLMLNYMHINHVDHNHPPPWISK